MSSSLLYRALGFRQDQCQRTTTDQGIVTLHLQQEPKHDRCSYCQSPGVIRHGAEERSIRTVPIGGKPVELRLPVPRLGCRKCGRVRQAAIRFAAPFRRFSHAFERYALSLLSHMTIRIRPRSMHRCGSSLLTFEAVLVLAAIAQVGNLSYFKKRIRP